jgi:AcrR family transcriptional regulator
MDQPSAKGTEAKTSASRARDKVFAVAADLFYRKGIHVVGVDEIVKAAGVAKISLYRNFASKDELIVAYLRDRGANFLQQWDAAFDVYRDDPRAQLRAILHYVAERTTQAGYRGCPFINFCGEFANPDHPGREVVREVKEGLRQRFLELAQRLGAAQPQPLADGFLLLVEGAYAISQTRGGELEGIGLSLLWAGEALVDAHCSRAGREFSGA